MKSEKLSNLQLELLKIFSYQLSNQQLLDVRNILAKYFAEQATNEMDKLWEENNWNMIPWNHGQMSI